MSYRPYGPSYPVPAPAAAVYSNALTLEFLARDLGYVYLNGCWTYPNQSYGNELCTVSQQNQVTVPSLNCVGDNTTYDLQIGLPVLTSIAIVGLGSNYTLPPALLPTTGVPTAQAQLDYQAVKMYLGKSFSLMNSTTVHTYIKDYREPTSSAAANILTIVDTNLATSTWPIIAWGPGTVVTFKTVLLGESVLGFLFDGITTTPICIVQEPLSIVVSPSVFSGRPITIAIDITGVSLLYSLLTPMFGQVLASVPIPFFTGPVLGGSSSTITIPHATGACGGFNMLGANVPVGTPIQWYSSTSTGSSGNIGIETPLVGPNFSATLPTNLIARLVVQVRRGVMVPPAGRVLATPTGTTLDYDIFGQSEPGTPFVNAVCVNPSLSSYTMQVNYS